MWVTSPCAGCFFNVCSLAGIFLVKHIMSVITFDDEALFVLVTNCSYNKGAQLYHSMLLCFQNLLV